MFRPWESLGIGEAQRAMDAWRVVFWGAYLPIWYLGERVVLQQSRSAPVIPVDPPPNMYLSRDLVTYTESGETSIGYKRVLIPGAIYQEALLPRLAPFPTVEVISWCVLFCLKIAPKPLLISLYVSCRMGVQVSSSHHRVRGYSWSDRGVDREGSGGVATD